MPAEIILPVFLEEKLRDAPHKHVVQKSLHDFSDWIRVSERPFFKDYTDHDIQHITQVLTTAANLIPESARPHFSGADAAALILAVLFHDSALHLSEAGFQYLIKGIDTPYAPLPAFDSTGWAQTWVDFMFLARRWDDAKILGVFGGDNGVPTAAVRDPFPHWDDLKRTDKLLVGEFIRQHHPRLAHEMALHGVPGVSGPLLKLDESLPIEWRDLVGLIARSHGLPLRACLDYLKNAPDFGEEARREYQGIHAGYLMALLRVADYVQIQGDRTSNRIFTYKKIYSGVSTIEHKAHQAVRNITTTTDDPEALFIQARPDEVAVFLRLQEWLAGIQQELDGSWAVLGEVYGRHDDLKNLGLTFRRVRSNLDNVKDFAKTVPYVPDRIRFDVARAELLKLLVGPLYGDDPSYGVRELMQNSIDAVREYDQFVLDNPQYKDAPRREEEADVVVELGPLDESTGYAVMTVSDRGIGMTEAIIRDYFLRAGASYRQSSRWKAAFETDVTNGPKSKILRSGRFGVGALAAFLIGEEVEIETRCITDKQGYCFVANLNNDAIDVKLSKAISVGTCLKIRVNTENYQKLLKTNSKVTRPAYWDWYCYNYPTVKRFLFHPKRGRELLYKQFDFSENMLSIGWRKLAMHQPYDIYWTNKNAPALSCNGLFVNDSGNLRNIPNELTGQPGRYRGYSVPYPQVAIVDPDGTFPLNLQRDAMRTREFPFGQELVTDVLSEMLGWLFFNGPVAIDSIKLSKTSLSEWLGHSNGYALVACAKGFGIRCETLLNDMSAEHIIIHNSQNVEVLIDSSNTLVFARDLDDYTYEYLADIKVKNQSKETVKANDFNFRYFSCRKEFSVKKAPRTIKIAEQNGKLKNGQLKNKFVVNEQQGPLLLLSTLECPISRFKTTRWPTELRKDTKPSDIFEERFYPAGSYLKVTSQPWLLDELWQEHFDKNWIPFALEDRIAKFPEAAQFFKERYPQVVPDEAWVLLGGRPS